MFSNDLQILFPEAALAVYAMLALLVGAYGGKDRVAQALYWVSAAALALAGLYVAVLASDTRVAFGGMFVDDRFARFCKVIILFSAAIVLLMSEGYMAQRGLRRFEYPVLIVLAAVGMMVIVSAGDLMTLYMGLELQSLVSYVIAAFRRDSSRSTEAGLKYFVLGAFSSGLLLYGCSLTYGFSGTTLFSGIMQAATSDDLSLGLLFGLVFVIAGIAFKISATPFHMWTPDVYEGAPTPVTAFFATAPKVATMAMLARVLFDAYGGAVGDWQQILAFLSVCSMFLGAFGAIGQRDFKRLMGYSTITHMGFALMGLAAGTALGVQAMLIYMAIYVTMNIGTFAFIMWMARDGQPVVDIYALNMYSKTDSLLAFAMLVMLFSLAGVPPFVGFFGKFYVLAAAVQAGLGWLAVLGVIASVIGAFYYLRIVYLIYFGEEGPSLDTGGSRVLWLCIVAAAGVLTVGVINLFGVDGLAAAAAASLVE